MKVLRVELVGGPHDGQLLRLNPPAVAGVAVDPELHQLKMTDADGQVTGIYRKTNRVTPGGRVFEWIRS